MGASNIHTDSVAEAGFVEANPAAIDAVYDTRSLFLTDAQTPVFGYTTLAIALTEGTNCDADSRVWLNALVNTTGALTAPPTALVSTTTAPGFGLLASD